MDNAINKLIERAELCIERGQIKMAQVAYDEIDNRLDAVTQDEFTEDRLSAIFDAIHRAEIEEANPKQYPTCHKCKGSGTYGSLGKCFACVGKGYQTERDIVREKNYWARRERGAQTRQEIESQYF